MNFNSIISLRQDFDLIAKAGELLESSSFISTFSALVLIKQGKLHPLPAHLFLSTVPDVSILLGSKEEPRGEEKTVEVVTNAIQVLGCGNK